MTNGDKTFIARMQRNQLENGGNLAFDDYYNRCFRLSRAAPAGSHLTADLHNLVEKATHGPNAAADKRKQASIQSKLASLNPLSGPTFVPNQTPTSPMAAKPRRANVQAAGALGVIALTNIASPKQLIKVKVYFEREKTTRFISPPKKKNKNTNLILYWFYIEGEAIIAI